MTKLSKIIFFGNERLASGIKHGITPTLEGLIEAGYEVVAIVSHNHEGVSRNARALEVEKVAKVHNIPVLLPEKPIQIYKQLEYFGAEVGVLSSYGRIVPQVVIDMFPKGIINVHPSLLPKYRGSTPIETAILKGDKTTGVSVMKLVRRMDAGGIYAQTEVEIGEDEDKIALYERLAMTGAKLLVENLPGIIDGTVRAKKQDKDKATYCEKLDKSMSNLDVVNLTTDECLRRIRALINWPKSKMELLGAECVIVKARKNGTPETEIDQRCKDGSYLIIDRLVPASGREMAAKDFINGRKGLGSRV
jgi:methionyl-tRNA formyltransferase